MNRTFIYSNRVKGEGGQTVFGGQARALPAFRAAHHTGLPMTGKPQLCDKELQCISEPQLQLSKTVTLSEISSWEWTHSHSPTLNRSLSNLRFPHTSFLCTNIAKSHKLLSWQSTQEWNTAMSNVFLKTGWNLRIALKMSLKMKRELPSGCTWELFTEGMTQFWKSLPKATCAYGISCNEEVRPHHAWGLLKTIFQRSQGTFSIYYTLGKRLS